MQRAVEESQRSWTRLAFHLGFVVFGQRYFGEPAGMCATAAASECLSCPFERSHTQAGDTLGALIIVFVGVGIDSPCQVLRAVTVMQVNIKYDDAIDAVFVVSVRCGDDCIVDPAETLWC